MNIVRYLKRKEERDVLYDYKTVNQALRYMRSHGYAEMPVINQESAYLGTVKEGDFLWHIVDYGGYENCKNTKVQDIIRKGSVPALKITATDEELERAALRCAIVPIIDDRGIFVGVVHSKDIVRYFADKWKACEQKVNA